MTDIFDRPVTDASAWTAAEMRGSDAWVHVLSEADLADLDSALRGVQARGLDMAQVTREEFPLPVLAPFLGELENEVRTGRGFYVVRGIPTERYTEEEVFMLTWGIGTHVGNKVSQNAYGDLLGHVFDHGLDPNEVRTRGYQSSDRLMFHVDRADMTALLCLRQAKEGGLSQIVSSTSVHNKLLAEHPEVLPPLYEGIPYINIEAVGDLVTWKEPAYSTTGGHLNCTVRRNTVQRAIDKGNVAMSEAETAALRAFDAATEDPDLVLEMELEPGDIQFVNNYTILHGRSAFVDYGEPGKRRHLVRLWLQFFTPRPTADYIRSQFNGINKELEHEAGYGLEGKAL
ncbi:MAG: TauD/TfdA family dioxygenase [Rhodospirillales bacterium]